MREYAEYKAAPLVKVIRHPHMPYSYLLQRLAIEEGSLTERPAMFTPELYRAKAAECTELAKTTNDLDDAREFQRCETSFTVLADNEQWLADHYEQTVHRVEVGGANEIASALIGETTAAAEDEHSLAGIAQ